MDYSGLEKIAVAAGFTLDSEFAQINGICVREPGQPRNVPLLNGNPLESQVYRHFRKDNSSFGYVDQDGSVTLELRFCPVSTRDQVEHIPTALDQYFKLVIALSKEGIPFTPDNALQRSVNNLYINT